MGADIQGSGDKTKCMGQVVLNGLMVVVTLVSLQMINRMVKEFLTGQMGVNSKVYIEKENVMESGSTPQYKGK